MRLNGGFDIPLFIQFSLFAIVLLLLIVFTGFFAITWPQFLAPALGLMWFTCVVIDIRGKYRIVDIVGEQYDRITPSASATFVGLYRPHWEIGHIQIARSKRWLGFIPTFESWAPYFEAEFPIEFDILECDSNFLIKFTGTPSQCGQFGHRGGMDREIRITEFIDVRAVPKSAA